MEIVEAIVSNGHGPLSPSFFVVHETANPGATAANHVSYWRREPTFAVHYVLDWEECYHCVPNDRLAYHVGGGNSQTYGVELCHATSRADFEKVWKSGVELCAAQLRARGWGVDRLLSHWDCTRRWGGSDHTDPIGYFEEYGRTWEDFTDAVRRELARKELEVTATEVWSYINKRLETVEAYTLLRRAAHGHEKTKTEVWGYRNAKLEEVDAYQILRDIRDAAMRLEDSMDEVKALLEERGQ